MMQMMVYSKIIQACQVSRIQFAVTSLSKIPHDEFVCLIKVKSYTHS